MQAQRFGQSTEKFEVEGRILHAVTQTPVRSLQVDVEAWQEWIGRQVGVTTGADGTFSLDSLSETDQLVLHGTGNVWADTISVSAIPWAIR